MVTGAGTSRLHSPIGLCAGSGGKQELFSMKLPWASLHGSRSWKHKFPKGGMRTPCRTSPAPLSRLSQGQLGFKGKGNTTSWWGRDENICSHPPLPHCPPVFTLQRTCWYNLVGLRAKSELFTGGHIALPSWSEMEHLASCSSPSGSVHSPICYEITNSTYITQHLAINNHMASSAQWTQARSVPKMENKNSFLFSGKHFKREDGI